MCLKYSGLFGGKSAKCLSYQESHCFCIDMIDFKKMHSVIPEILLRPVISDNPNPDCSTFFGNCFTIPNVCKAKPQKPLCIKIEGKCYKIQWQLMETGGNRHYHKYLY